jgi:phosphopantetheinyl transferase (holo-ACP synthase)
MNGRVGNDVVDLEDPRVIGKADDERFVRRVFAEDEREAIRTALDADLELWSRWAAKEAAFKVVSKFLPQPPVFEHASFAVSWGGVAPSGAPDSTAPRIGRVAYRDWSVPVTVSCAESAIHAVGAAAEEGTGPLMGQGESRVELLDEPDAAWSAPQPILEERFTPDELDAVHSLESAAVRIGARAHLSAMMGVDEHRLEIVCAPGVPGRRPPRVRLDGAPATADVSLSHHGRWIAWVCYVE